MKKVLFDEPPDKLRPRRLLVWLGLREANHLLAGLELTTLLEQLDAFETLENVALRHDRAGAFERTMLRHIMVRFEKGRGL